MLRVREFTVKEGGLSQRRLWGGGGEEARHWASKEGKVGVRENGLGACLVAETAAKACGSREHRDGPDLQGRRSHVAEAGGRGLRWPGTWTP